MQNTMMMNSPILQRFTESTGVILLLVIAFAIGSATFWHSLSSPSSLSSNGGSGHRSSSAENGTSPLMLASAENQEEEVEGIQYDPMAFDALLGAYVSNGLVNYKALTNNQGFTDFVESLQESNPTEMTTDEQLAFWVNAYNACVISNVIAHPKIKGPLEVDGFFDKVKFDVAGQQLTLNEIENSIVRPTFNEPLIHFGLVCAARSCPPLIPKAYTEANVREELAANARNYLADKKQNRFDAKSGKLSLSKIFEWYKADFGGDDAGLIAFAKQYGPEEMRVGLEKAKKVTIAFVEYDWTLNSQ